MFFFQNQFSKFQNQYFSMRFFLNLIYSSSAFQRAHFQHHRSKTEQTAAQSMSRSPGRWSSAWDENRYEKRAEEVSAPQKRPRIVCVIFLYTPHHILKNKKVLKNFQLFFLVDQIVAKIDLVTQKGIPMFTRIVYTPSRERK